VVLPMTGLVGGGDLVVGVMGVRVLIVVGVVVSCVVGVVNGVELLMMGVGVMGVVIGATEGEERVEEVTMGVGVMVEVTCVMGLAERVGEERVGEEFLELLVLLWLLMVEVISCVAVGEEILELLKGVMVLMLVTGLKLDVVEVKLMEVEGVTADGTERKEVGVEGKADGVEGKVV
jgi:hypothetical protein